MTLLIREGGNQVICIMGIRPEFLKALGRSYTGQQLETLGSPLAETSKDAQISLVILHMCADIIIILSNCDSGFLSTYPNFHGFSIHFYVKYIQVVLNI